MLRVRPRELFVRRSVGSIVRGPRRERDASSISASALTSVTANASANTKGSYVTIVASVPFDCDGFFLALGSGTAVRDYLIDLAIGGAGSEVDFISNLLFSSPNTASLGDYGTVYIPLPLKAGTRLSARCQASTGSAVLTVGVSMVSGPMYRAQRCRRATTYGANTADSGGTSVDAGGSANTKGAWAQLSASISRMKYAVVCVGNQVNGARTNATMLLDIGTGAAASEVVRFHDLYVRQEAVADKLRPELRGRWLCLPPGVRLAARSSCSLTDATDRLMDIVVIGFD